MSIATIASSSATRTEATFDKRGAMLFPSPDRKEKFKACSVIRREYALAPKLLAEGGHDLETQGRRVGYLQPGRQADAVILHYERVGVSSRFVQRNGDFPIGLIRKSVF